MVGAVVLITSTVKLQAPPPSADVTLTEVIPRGKNEPEAGEAVMAPQSPETSTSPVLKVTKAPSWPLCVVLTATTKFEGQLKEQVAGSPPGVEMLMDASEELLARLGSAVSLDISARLVTVEFGALLLTV
jgi:hypothetical protein